MHIGVGRPVGYPKSGGRKKGGLNKRTLDIEAQIKALDCNLLSRIPQMDYQFEDVPG